MTKLDLGKKVQKICPIMVLQVHGSDECILRKAEYYRDEDIEKVITRMLKLAETIEKVRDYIGCGIHDEDGNLKRKCTISITELDNCFEWLDEALAARRRKASRR